MGSIVEDNMGYHGKALGDQTQKAMEHLDSLIQNKSIKMEVKSVKEAGMTASTVEYSNSIKDISTSESMFAKNNKLATR